MDYQKELETYADAPAEEKAELEKLANLQRDIAIAGSAEDFIRHPFFGTFEKHLNEIISDAKGKFLEIKDMSDLQLYKARIAAIQEVKQWLNSKVIAGRVARQAIEIYESDTEAMNEKIQAAVDQSNLKS